MCCVFSTPQIHEAICTSVTPINVNNECDYFDFVSVTGVCFYQLFLRVIALYLENKSCLQRLK